MGFTLFNNESTPILSSTLLDQIAKIEMGAVIYKIEIPVNILKSGDYKVEGAIWNPHKVFEQNDCLANLNILNATNLEAKGLNYKGILVNDKKWEYCGKQSI